MKLLITKTKAMELVSMEGMEKTFKKFVEDYKLRKYRIGRNVFFNLKELELCLTKQIIQYTETKEARSGGRASTLKLVGIDSARKSNMENQQRI